MASPPDSGTGASNPRSHTRKSTIPSQLPPGSTHSFALSFRPKVTRNSVSKVRTGCLTCKKRHVKCDEAKPSCQRCMKWQGYCGGYEENNKKSKQKPTTTQVANRSRTTKARRDGVRKPLSILSPSDTILENPSDSVFTTQLDHDYFAAWKRLSWGLSGGVFPSKVYATSMFQLGQQEPAIRHAIMALGCMTFAFKNDFSLDSRRGRSKHESVHYKNALINYGRSMKLLRNAPPGERSVRNALMCCILFTAFEAMNNNRKAMLKHLDHGLSLLRHFVSAATGQRYEADVRSPNPYVVEDDVLHVFYGLDLHTWLTFIFAPKGDPPGPYVSGTVDLAERMPGAFGELMEARRWFAVTQHFVMDYSRQLAILRKPQYEAAQKNGTSLPDFHDVPNWDGIRVKYVDALKQWLASFEPLHEKARKNKHADKTAWRQATIMKMEYLFMYCTVYSVSYSHHASLVSLEPEFRETLQLAERFLQDPGDDDDEEEEDDVGAGIQQQQQPFKLDSGVIPAVFVTATKCQQRDVRQHAMRILARYPRREGLWESKSAAAIAAWGNSIHDEYAAAGFSGQEHWYRMRERLGVFDEQGLSMIGRAKHIDRETGAVFVRDDLVTW